MAALLAVKLVLQTESLLVGWTGHQRGPRMGHQWEPRMVQGMAARWEHLWDS